MNDLNEIRKILSSATIHDLRVLSNVYANIMSMPMEDNEASRTLKSTLNLIAVELAARMQICNTIN